MYSPKFDTRLHLADLAIALTIELSLFKQDQTNLAHLLSKLITIGTDELRDDNRLQCVVFGIFRSRRIDFRHAVKKHINIMFAIIPYLRIRIHI